MVFSSVTFLTLFLPITLGIYLITPKRAKNVWLLLASLGFYAFGEPLFVFLFMVEIVWNWAFALGIEKHRGVRAGTVLFIVCLVLDLGMLAVFKYAALPAQTLNAALGLSLVVPEIALPIGISFYTFQEISYIIDVYRGEKAQRNPLDVGLYLALFPQMIAGPIVRYSVIAPQLHDRPLTREGLTDGFMRFCMGLCKKVLIANQLGMMADKVFSTGDFSAPLVWLGTIAYALQIFFDFSGYSDMAIGLAKMFGFKIPENFNLPYRAGTATEFWRRWHISLSSWFRDYVYFPLGGSRCSAVKTIRNLVVVWALTGLWHGASWTFVAWGLGWGVLIIIEKFIAKPTERSQAVKIIYRIAFIVCMLLLWVLFRADDFSLAADMIGRMFSPASWALASSQLPQLTLWLEAEAVYLVAGLFLALGFGRYVSERVPKEGTAHSVVVTLGVIALAALTVLSISYIVQGTYNPFLYFQF